MRGEIGKFLPFHQRRLVTVIRGGATTPPNKDFIEAKKHGV